MKIFVMLETFLPQITPSGNLISHLLPLINKNFKVEIICQTNNQNTEDIVNNIKVRRFRKNVRITDKLLSKIRRLPMHYNEEMNLFLIETINNSEEKIILLPITSREILLATCLKEQFPSKIILVPFLLEEIHNFFKLKDIRNLHSRIENFCDEIFILPKLENYFTNRNVIQLEHPMIIDNISTSIKTKKKIVYIGGLDKVNRNPQKILDFIKKMDKYNKDVFFNFYGYGSVDYLLKKVQSETSNFTYHGSVEYSKALEILRDSSLIITIGNKNTNLVPSKLFDCISTGNPIVHFYQDNNDPYLTYLKEYPYHLNVPMNNIDYDKVVEFINNNFMNRSNFDFIEKKYFEYTPEKVYSDMHEVIMKYEEK
ncbi:MAG: hypothetical protein Q4G63_13155 [Bacteroidia bacterium]|nr:hypothetical protein [Bacteroidia bacterium]